MADRAGVGGTASEFGGTGTWSEDTDPTVVEAKILLRGGWREDPNVGVALTSTPSVVDQSAAQAEANRNPGYVIAG